MNDEVREMACLMLASIIIILVSFCFGLACATFCERSAAIEAGAGGWVVDAETGDTRFVYGKGMTK